MNDTCEWKIKWDGCMEHYLWINIEFEKPNEFNFIDSWYKPPVIQIPITFMLSSRSNGKEYYERMRRKNEPFRRNKK